MPYFSLRMDPLIRSQHSGSNQKYLDTLRGVCHQFPAEHILTVQFFCFLPQPGVSDSVQSSLRKGRGHDLSSVLGKDISRDLGHPE